MNSVLVQGVCSAVIRQLQRNRCTTVERKDKRDPEKRKTSILYLGHAVRESHALNFRY